MMKLLLIASVFASVLAGCAKANDMGRMEDEVVAVATSYYPTVHELELRANELRKVKLDPEASSRLREATTDIQHMKGEIEGTKNRVELDKKASTDPDFLQRKLDGVEHNLREGIIDASIHLEAVENWLAVEERRPNHGAAGMP